jgi:hypothetical protein
MSTYEIAVMPQAAEEEATRPGGGWLLAFILFQMACLLVLLFSFAEPLRPLLRIACFAASGMLALCLPMGGTRQHGSALAAVGVMVILAASFFNPGTSGTVAGLAQFAIYACTLAPLFWVCRLRLKVADLRRALIAIWIFHTVSAGLGVLQVYYPGRFQPAVSSTVGDRKWDYQESLKITNAAGERVYRPMGLTDIPGAASLSAFYAVLFGLVIGFSGRATLRAIAGVSMVVGLSCLYMSQVRAILVMLAASVVTFCGFLFLRGEFRRLMVTAGTMAVIAIVSFSLAIAIAGDSVTKRLGTFLESSPDEMYYGDRGHFLADTMDNLLPKYPFGAGLGRWGMINSYFGDNSDPDRQPIWVEIQLTGWLVDGGLPLIAAYSLAILVAFWEAARIALARGSDDIWIWAVAVIAYDLGALAMSFDYPFFNSQSGMELWVLNAALVAVWRNMESRQLAGEMTA